MSTTCVSLPPSSSGLPSTVGAGLALWRSTFEGKLWEEAADRIRLPRAGYCGVDLLFFFVLFCASGTGSIKEFSSRSLGFRQRVAATVGRASLMSASSVSRTFSRVEGDVVDAFRSWLLLDFSEARVLLKEEHLVCHRDRQGTRWHGFDLDPVRLAVRRRGVPQGDDLPEARRRCSSLVAPGHTGRKRGQVVASQYMLTHAGSQLIVDVTVAPGNGVPEQYEAALDAVAGLTKELGSNPAFIRMDGEFSGVGKLKACEARGLAALTRVKSNTLLANSEVRRALKAAEWQPVPSSGSGPQRFAADLGIRCLESGDEFVETRIVVSRCLCTNGRGRGEQIGDQRFELFAALSLPSGAFTASDIVATYYARAAVENQFAAHQRILFTEHKFSQNPQGLRLARLLMAAHWNRMVLVGQQRGRAEPVPLEANTTQPPDLPGEFVVDTAEEPGATSIGALDWGGLLRKRPGWSWDASRCVLRHPTGCEMRLKGLFGKTLRFKGTGGKQASFTLHGKDFRMAHALLNHGAPVPPRPPPRREDSRPQMFPAVLQPAFSAARACRAAQQEVSLIWVTLTVGSTTPIQSHRSPASIRQHRRLTWQERLCRYAVVASGVVLGFLALQ